MQNILFCFFTSSVKRATIFSHDYKVSNMIESWLGRAGPIWFGMRSSLQPTHYAQLSIPLYKSSIYVWELTWTRGRTLIFLFHKVQVVISVTLLCTHHSTGIPGLPLGTNPKIFVSSVSLNLELEKFTGFDREQICREVVAYDSGAFFSSYACKEA